MMPPPMPRGPAKQFVPDEVLSRAAETFRARGYRGTSISMLVKEMGIGRQSIYETFGDKRSLFLRAIEGYADAADTKLRSTLEGPGTPLNNLRRQLAIWQEANDSPGSRGCMIGGGCADFNLDDPAVADALRRSLERCEQAVGDALVRAQAVGELPQHLDARVIARTIVCLSQGVALIGRVTDQGGLARDALGGLLMLLTPLASATCQSAADAVTERV